VPRYSEYSAQDVDLVATHPKPEPAKRRILRTKKVFASP
jgi:hypothetical protein